MPSLPIRHGFLARWYARHITMDEFPVDDLGALRALLAGRYGINARGWRLYLDYGDALFERLGEPWAAEDCIYATGHNGVAYLRLLQACETDVLPPLALLASLKDWHIPHTALRHVPPLFFRAAWKACIAAEYGGVPIERFTAETVAPLARWYFNSGHHLEPDTNLLKSGWPALERRFGEWQRARCVWEEETRPAPDEWPPYVRRVESAGLCFIALCSEAALQAEGIAMVHYVGGYGDHCHDGWLRLFSVRDAGTGARVATLALATNAPGRWEVHDLKGRYNAPVTEDIARIALQAADSLQEAYALVPAIRRLMDKFWQPTEPQRKQEWIDDDVYDDCPL